MLRAASGRAGRQAVSPAPRYPVNRTVLRKTRTLVLPLRHPFHSDVVTTLAPVLSVATLRIPSFPRRGRPLSTIRLMSRPDRRSASLPFTNAATWAIRVPFGRRSSKASVDGRRQLLANGQRPFVTRTA